MLKTMLGTIYRIILFGYNKYTDKSRIHIMNISVHLTYEKASSLSVQNSLGLEYNKYTDKGCIHVRIYIYIYLST